MDLQAELVVLSQGKWVGAAGERRKRRRALVGAFRRGQPEQKSAFKTASGLWAEATTAATTPRRDKVMHDKVAAVTGFFDFIQKHPAAVRSQDVQACRLKLEADQLKPGYIEKICKNQCVGFNVRN